MQPEDIRDKLIERLEQYRAGIGDHYRWDLFALFTTAYKNGHVTRASQCPLTADAIRDFLVERWRPDDTPEKPEQPRLIEQVHTMWYEWTYALRNYQ